MCFQSKCLKSKHQTLCNIYIQTLCINLKQYYRLPLYESKILKMYNICYETCIIL